MALKILGAAMIAVSLLLVSVSARAIKRRPVSVRREYSGRKGGLFRRRFDVEGFLAVWGRRLAPLGIAASLVLFSVGVLLVAL